MMDGTAYQNALERQRELKRELKEIERFLEMYKKFSGSGSEVKNTAGRSRHVRDQDLSGASSTSIPQERIEAEVRQILIAHGSPMTRGQLVQALRSQGLVVGGKDESKNLGTKIWRAGNKFVNIPEKGYWPTDLPCPAIGYEPPSDDERDLLK